MVKTKLFKTLIPIALIVLAAYFSYIYFLKDIYLNNQTQTIQIDDLSENKQLELKKHEGQSEVSSLEIEIKGQTDQTIMLLIGTSKNSMLQTIALKKGKLDFSTAVEWNQDNCFILIPASIDSNPDFTIDYRFISSKN